MANDPVCPDEHAALQLKVEALQDMVGYVSLHIRQRELLRHLTAEQKELWAESVERWQVRLHADDPHVELSSYDRWWN